MRPLQVTRCGMPTSGRVAMAVVLAVVIAIVEAEKDATTTTRAYPPTNTSTTPVPVSTDPSANKQNWKGVSLGSPAAKAGVVFAAAFLVSPPDPTTAAPAHTHTRCEVYVLRPVSILRLHFSRAKQDALLRSPLVNTTNTAGCWLVLGRHGSPKINQGASTRQVQGEAPRSLASTPARSFCVCCTAVLCQLTACANVSYQPLNIGRRSLLSSL